MEASNGSGNAIIVDHDRSFFKNKLINFKQIYLVVSHCLTHRITNSEGLHEFGSQKGKHIPDIDRNISGLHCPRPF